MLQPGPATYIDLTTIDLSLEAPLDPADSYIVTPGLEDIARDVEIQSNLASDGMTELQRSTFDLYKQLNIVEAEINLEAGAPPSPASNAIVEGLAEADQAIEDAAAAIPLTSSTPDGSASGYNQATTGNPDPTPPPSVPGLVPA